MIQNGAAARPRQRREWWIDGEAKAIRSMARNPRAMKVMPTMVTMHSVSKVPFLTPRRMKLRCEQFLSR